MNQMFTTIRLLYRHRFSGEIYKRIPMKHYLDVDIIWKRDT